MNTKSSYILAIALIMALINPSYGSAVRRLGAASKSGNRKLLATTYSDKLCVDFKYAPSGNADWLSPYSGDYTYSTHVNGKPSYTLSSCKDTSNCYLTKPTPIAITLSISAETNGKWKFLGDPISNPFCETVDALPSMCASWWGVGEGRAQPTITQCGDIIPQMGTDTTTTTTTTSTTTTSTASPASLGGSSLTAAQQKALVNRHNLYRQKAANGEVSGLPKATTTMPNLEWDSKLAAVAQEWANGCVWQHRSNGQQRYCAEVGNGDCDKIGTWVWSEPNANGVRTATPYGSQYSIGENLALGYSTVEAAVDGWFNEYKTYSWSSSSYNHLTQVVWDKTTKIGCGFKQCSNLNGGMLVCNYNPAGNMVGQFPYNN